MKQFLFTGIPFKTDRVVYLWWNDGVMILKNEPLNVMGPETLLFYRLGLKQQVLVI